MNPLASVTANGLVPSPTMILSIENSQSPCEQILCFSQLNFNDLEVGQGDRGAFDISLYRAFYPAFQSAERVVSFSQRFDVHFALPFFASFSAAITIKAIMISRIPR